MKTVAASVVLVAAGFCWMAGQSVTAGTTHADNATPVATTTVTLGTPAVVPSAKSLLAAALAQFAAQKTVHVKYGLSEKLPIGKGVTIAMASEGDMSLVKPQQGHLVTAQTVSGVGQPSQTLPVAESIFRGKPLASRSGIGPWKCTKLKTSLSSTQLSLSPSISGPSAAHTTLHFSKALNLGPETIDGTPVWHLRNTGRLSVGAKKTLEVERLQLEYYVAQSDLTLRRLTEIGAATISKQKLTANVTADFSMYGEPVNVVLPAECNTVSHLGVSAPDLPVAGVAPDPQKLVPQLRAFLKPVM